MYRYSASLIGPWSWSSGQRACLLLQRPSSNPPDTEVAFLIYCSYGKSKIHEKDVGVDHIKNSIRVIIAVATEKYMRKDTIIHYCTFKPYNHSTYTYLHESACVCIDGCMWVVCGVDT